MKRILRPLAYLWASPNTALGLLIGIIGLAGGARVSVVCGNIEFCGGWLRYAGTWSFISHRMSAITLGHVILDVSQEVLAELRDHENAHVRQYERWGPLFVPAYGLSSLWQAICGRDPYMENHFERQAFNEAAQRALRPDHSLKAGGHDVPRI